MNRIGTYLYLTLVLVLIGCSTTNQSEEKSASDIFGNPEYLAISYGGYRASSRDIQPTIMELKEDMRLLSAMGIRVLRTYNVHLPQASNLLKAIRELKEENKDFEMYVMLGVWIDCKDAWTSNPDHNAESPRNAIEIKSAVDLANQYPDIIKVIAVGNEAMVKWAASYFVQPKIILKWVNHLQKLKETGKLPSDLWITSSDDFSSWGGGGTAYHTKDLDNLFRAVDYVSMHTYPYHNTHYNPEFWKRTKKDSSLTKTQMLDAAMLSGLNFAKNQYDSVSNYMKSIGVDKPVHIGETGWATVSNGFYGENGSKAADEYKQGKYYSLIRDWTNAEGISCFYFEAFNEQWKDAQNKNGSENHFGLINLKSQAKYPIWNLVDEGAFKDLTRDGKPITKTFGGSIDSLMENVSAPPEINIIQE